MFGVPYIFWDNIARGATISCPHIEKSCTAAYYADRKLGVSEMVKTAASTMHLFTGNNIGPRGDLASRRLHVRLNIDRRDPENREFQHPDPIGWTDDCAEILAALYRILMGNPQLKTLRDAPSKTRLKMWWRLIGSAVGYAAELSGETIDFQELFLAQEDELLGGISLATSWQLPRGIPRGFATPQRLSGACILCKIQFDASERADLCNAPRAKCSRCR